MAGQREFSPAVEARRAAKAEKDARLLSTAADCLDVGKGYGARQAVGRVMDGAEELAKKRAARSVELGRRLRHREELALRRETLAEQAGRQPAGQGQRRRLSPREWLEAIGPEGRRDIEETAYFQRQSAEVQASILRLRDEVDELDEEAELLIAQENEQRALADIDDSAWPFEEQDAMAAWNASEEQAAIETAGPLYEGEDLDDVDYAEGEDWE